MEALEDYSMKNISSKICLVFYLIILFFASSYQLKAELTIELGSSITNFSYSAFAPHPLRTQMLTSLRAGLSEIWSNGAGLTADSFSLANYQTPLIGSSKVNNYSLGLIFSTTFVTNSRSTNSELKEFFAANKGGAGTPGIVFSLKVSNVIDLIFHTIYLPETKWLKNFENFKVFGGGATIRLNFLGNISEFAPGFQSLVIKISSGGANINKPYSLDLNDLGEYQYEGIQGIINFSSLSGNMKIKQFYLGLDVKAYFKLLSFLNLFLGFGFIYNHSSIEISAIGQATNTFNGYTSPADSVRIYGKTILNHLLVDLMLALSFDFKLIKIPVMLAMAWSPKNEKVPIWNFTIGISSSF